MTIRMLMVVIAVLAAGKVQAQEGAKPPPFDPGSYPLEVQKALHYANAECAVQGGGEGACGTGGCVMDILVTLPGGQVRRVFDGYVRNYEILAGKGPRTIRFELH